MLRRLFIPAIRKLNSTLWPRKIIGKVALSNVVVLAITIFSLTLYAYYDKQASLVSEALDQYSEYSKKISKISKNYLVDARIDELEFLLVSLMSLHGQHSLCIKDVGFNSLIALKSNGRKITAFKEQKQAISPVATGQFLQVKNGNLEIWQEIGESNKQGWVYITKPVSNIDILSLDYIKITITALIFSIIVNLVLLQRILREPMQSLKRAAEFSQWLDMAQGNRLTLKTSSWEVEQLVEKLNFTSERLFQSGLLQKTRHILVDTIREIQTLYIENNSKQVLYDKILAKTVNLSKSEFGFLAEVRKDKSGEEFLSVKNFSNLAENVSMQNFMANHSPAAMEFRNKHNLMGVILQTRKPTISNDAQGDPRGSGTPPGHPPLYTYLGIPVFHADQMVAVVGLANRRPGYDNSVVEYLQPLLETVANVVVAFRNQDEQIDSIRDLEQQEVLLRRILATVSDSVITINSGGFIQLVNPATEDMFGYLKEELVHQHVNSIVPRLFNDDFYKNYVQSGIKHNSGLTGRHKSGSNLQLELSVSEFSISGERLFTLTLNDISHLQQLDATESEPANEYLDVQSIVHAGTWSLQLKSGRFKASTEVFNILNMKHSDSGEIPYAEFVDRIAVADQELLRMAIARCVVDKSGFLIDVCLKEVEDTPAYIQIQGQVHERTKTEEPVVVGVIQDVTGIRKVLQQKDEFISSLSEEIRSPLATIRGSIGMLSGQTAGQFSSADKELLDTVYKNTDRILLYVNDIIDIENISLGKSEFNMEFLQGKKLLEEVVSRNKRLESQYGVRIELNIKHKDIVFIADQQRMFQLLEILLSNAAKHSTPGEKVELIAELVENMMVITVKDYGEGIPLEMQSTLFDLYARSENIHSAENPDSTGLGLCIAKAIVDRHQGRLNFQSTPGGGSTFYLELPVPQQNVAVLNL